MRVDKYLIEFDVKSGQFVHPRDVRAAIHKTEYRLRELRMMACGKPHREDSQVSFVCMGTEEAMLLAPPAQPDRQKEFQDAVAQALEPNKELEVTGKVDSTGKGKKASWTLTAEEFRVLAM